MLLIKSYLSSVNSNTIHLQFDLFIINLFFLFTLIDRSIINTGLLKWFISFARINLDLLRDLVIQLLFVSFHFQYTYILRLISKLIRESIDRLKIWNDIFSKVNISIDDRESFKAMRKSNYIEKVRSVFNAVIYSSLFPRYFTDDVYRRHCPYYPRARILLRHLTHFSLPIVQNREREREREREAIPSVQAFSTKCFLNYSLWNCMLYSIEEEKKKKKNLFLHELIISAVKYFTVYFIEKSFRKCSTIVWYFSETSLSIFILNRFFWKIKDK